MTNPTCSNENDLACTTAETATRWARPHCDAWAGDEGGHVLVNLPGVAPEGLDVRIDDGELVVEARAALPTPDGRPLHREWHPTAYRRTFQLAADADPTAISARLENGVLALTIPRKEAAKARRIEVQVVG